MVYFALLVAFSLPYLGIGSPIPGVIYAAAPESRGAFHVGGKGVYNYGYNTGDGIAKVEVRYPDGTVTGSYRYYDANGDQVVRSYIADDRGFRVLGNKLPVSPGTSAVAIVGEQTLLATVEGDNQKISRGNRFTVNAPPTFSSSLNKYDDGIEKHKEAIRKQEQLIRKETKLLEKLIAQKSGTTVVQQTIPTNVEVQNGYIETSNSVINSPYFYAQDNIQYDFPAGFAYDTPVIYPSAVPVEGFHNPPAITSGLLANSNLSPHYSRPVRRRYRRPDLYQYIGGN